ncbi:hypothetical protein AVEN_94688-1 [Araneus ventricosus]|uniref:Uncharacterized protein n=1 Tax=Araneus ventricosus TaxID=182803 RepID=A0A4Y2I6J9_ARAVE|nr:hypothetical protein AVEN_94688-1 [Araneus ventricosus]
MPMKVARDCKGILTQIFVRSHWALFRRRKKALPFLHLVSFERTEPRHPFSHGISALSASPPSRMSGSSHHPASLQSSALKKLAHKRSS